MVFLCHVDLRLASFEAQFCHWPIHVHGLFVPQQQPVPNRPATGFFPSGPNPMPIQFMVVVHHRSAHTQLHAPCSRPTCALSGAPAHARWRRTIMGCKGDPPCLQMHARWSEVRDTGAGVYQPCLHACMAQSSSHTCTCYLTLPQVPSCAEGLECSVSITHYTPEGIHITHTPCHINVRSNIYPCDGRNAALRVVLRFCAIAGRFRLQKLR